MSFFRTDIQALRGIAVALVVFEHLGISYFKSGFLGVDIFFVISGYLITGIIASKLISGNFSIGEFYYRRAKRLLPAAYVTVLLTCIGSYFFLDAIELDNLFYQVIGSITYTTNFVLMNQAGYFDAAASSKPLLHMWSLAVEEQYYVLFPLVLFVLPARNWLAAVVLLLVSSILACLYMTQINPSAAFYLLPTRAWELLIGSAGYLLTKRFSFSVPKALFAASLILLVLLPTQEYEWSHPGGVALIICTATLLVLLSKSTLFDHSIFKPLIKLGDISYSLYLVHWPIIVFFQNGESGPGLKAALLIASLVAAVLLYVTVEKTFRTAQISIMRLTIGVALGSVVLLTTQYSISNYFKPDIDFSFIRRGNYGLDQTCDSAIFANSPKCRTSETADTLIWGDSYAMHTVEGIKNNLPRGLVQATYSACPPFLGTAPYTPTRPNAERIANSCIAFNDGVLEAIKADQNIKTVILAASFRQYTVPAIKMQTRSAAGEKSTSIRMSSLELAEQDLGNTVKVLQSLGKEVVLIGPPPYVGDENVSCMEQVLSGKLKSKDHSTCGISTATYRKDNAGVINLLDFIESNYKVKTIRLSDAICDANNCKTIIDGVPMYRDGGHLTYLGSAKAFDDLANARKLW
ncbi:acyltransferase [Aeromonas caviae]|uniref:acyltransferase family protein n=1 Tax=Aeromonas caviae TaxID=648 RepID=UPI002DBDCA3B|nr:acyltransferase family protein [Aeromonas caviae]MEB5773097.1 acyltransferase [Aeromonas caviae]MEB6648358.1 acyltransferase [Aeromonas caviae]